MKRILAAVLLLCLWACQDEEVTTVSLVHFVPKDAAMIFKINNLGAFTSNLNNNELIKENPKFHLTEDIKESLKSFTYLNTSEPVLIAFSKIDDNQLGYTLITKNAENLIQLDSITDKNVETLTYSNQNLKKITLNNTTTYTTKIKRVYIASNSQLLIEEVIRNHKANAKNTEMEKLLTSESTNASVFINSNNFSSVLKDYFPGFGYIPITKFADYMVLDLEVEQKSLQLNGIVAARDSIPKVLDLFKGNQPQETEIALATPLNSEAFYSFTYNDFSKLRANLIRYHAENRELQPLNNGALFSSAKEVGVIYHSTGNTVYLNSIDTETTKQALIASQEIETSYRDIPIYKFNEPDAFSFAFNPLIKTKNLRYYTTLNSYFLFAENVEALKNVIASIQNKTVLGLQDFYSDMKQSLSDESSMIFVANTDNFKDVMADHTDSEFKDAYTNFDFKDHKTMSLQLVYERDFAHVHAIVEKAGAKSSSTGISQMASIGLDANLRTDPQLFTNHTNGTKDILIQDEDNTLYLISNTGKVRWKKDLGAAILGEVSEVDLFRNGKIQMAFSTQDKVYILDRNGKPVAPFPLSFNDPITQPLAVFDYDNSRKYRFLVTQGNAILMYNKEGKSVTGFEFSKAEDRISTTPKHIRIGSKDYILIMEDSGKLYILSRTGSERVSFNTKLNPSDNDWYEYENSFTSTSTDGELLQISENGKLSKTRLGLPTDHYITATNRTFVSLAENELTIKGKTVSLDFGLYTRPKIFYINNKIYVAATDQQAHKVYLFDSNAILRPNFPVYGNSVIDFGNMDKDNALEFVVKGEDDSVLVYKVN